MMNYPTFLLALTIFGGADAKNLRVSNTASKSSSEDIPEISSSRKLQSSSGDIPTISSSRKLQSSSSEDTPTISSSRKLQSSSSEDIPTISSSRKLQSSSSEDTPTISSSRKLQSSSSEDIPTISSSRKLQSSSSEDIPTISSSRMLLTQAEIDSCYAIMDSTAVDDAINKDGYVEFLNLLAFGYLTENDITSFDDLSQSLKFAWTTLTCQCVQMGGADDCCAADRANLFVEGADGEPVSEEQTNFLNDICSTAMTTLGSEGWENTPPGEMPKPTDDDTEEIEQELPAQPTNPSPETLTPGQIVGMSVGIPLLFILLLLGTLYFCRDKEYKPEDGEEEDDELADLDKEVMNDEDSAVGTVLTAEASTVVGSQS